MARKKEENSWLNLNIKIDLESCLTRMVLFEKHSKKEGMTEFFMNKMNGCELFKHKKYLDYIFYIKNKEILIQQDLKNNVFYIKYDDFWSVFSRKFNLDYCGARTFTKNILKDFFKLQSFTTMEVGAWSPYLLENTLKSQDFTTHQVTPHPFFQLEDELKSQDFTTDGLHIKSIRKLESSLKLK